MDELRLWAERLKEEGVLTMDAFLDYMVEVVKHLNRIVYDAAWVDDLLWSYEIEKELLELVKAESWRKTQKHIMEELTWRLKKTK